MAVMEQKVNFFTILPNHKLGQFILKELTKYLGIFGYISFCCFGGLWKFPTRYAKVKTICLEWIMSPRLAGKVVNGILLSKLFWPTVRKYSSNDREKLLKFEAEGREFENILRSLEQFIQTVKGQNNFWQQNAF